MRRRGKPIQYPVLRESVINYAKLRSRKEELGLRYSHLVEGTGMSEATVSAALHGRETVNLQTLIDLARVLKYRVVVTFVPEEELASSADGERAAMETQEVKPRG